MTRHRFWGPVAFVVFLLLPAAAHAQSAFTGIVKDTSGAVLPGVTVEAASPVLIEKTRSVVTDETGGYRIVDLRPGIYTLTFTLEGFSPVKREGLELPSNFTMTINTELKVGALEETLTVTGAVADRRRAEHDEVAGAQPRSARRHSDRPHHPGHGTADHRRLAEPPGHRRLAAPCSRPTCRRTAPARRRPPCRSTA